MIRALITIDAKEVRTTYYEKRVIKSQQPIEKNGRTEDSARPLTLSVKIETIYRILELGRDAVEGVADALAQRGHGANDDNGDQSGDQRVFNGGDGALVDVELGELEGDGGTNIVDEHGG